MHLIWSLTTYHIAGNFAGAKLHGNASRLFRRNFCGFYFCETNASRSDHTPTVDGHAPHTNRRNDIERRSEEASMCNNALAFLLCGGLHNYESIRTATVGEKLAC